MDTNTLRRGLYNIRTRAAAMDEVIASGRDSLARVLPLLQDRDEGIRWAATRILAEIGDESAVLPLVTLLEQSRNTADVVQALKSITGQDLGDKPVAWREWALGSAGCGTGLLSDHELVAAALQGLPATSEGSGQEFVVSVTLPERRAQHIRIDFTAKDAEGNAVVQLTTPCGKASHEHYEAALKTNMSISYGAIGLALLDDELCFALTATHLRATIHPASLAKSIMSLARHGDAQERILSPSDAF